jgi:hypothetical protein
MHQISFIDPARRIAKWPELIEYGLRLQDDDGREAVPVTGLIAEASTAS